MLARGCFLIWLLLCGACPASGEATMCPVSAFDERTVFLSAPTQKLVGEGRFCPAAEVPGSTLHYGFGLSIGHLRGTSSPGRADIVVSDTGPPRLSYFWFHPVERQFKRAVIYEGPNSRDCASLHSVVADENGQVDCLMFESNFVADINCDGYEDVVVISFRHPTSIFWFENPGPKGGRWIRHPITNDPFKDGEKADLVSRSSPSSYSLPAASVYSAAPLHRAGTCKDGQPVVDIVYGPFAREGNLTVLKNPWPTKDGYSKAWASTSLPGTSANAVRTLLQMPNTGSANASGARRLLYAPLASPVLATVRPGEARQWASEAANLHIINVPADDSTTVDPVERIDRAYGFAVGTLGLVRPGGAPYAVVPYGYASQYPCTPPWRDVPVPPTDSGVYAYPLDGAQATGSAEAIYRGSEFPWPHHVAAGKVTSPLVDDLVVGTMCTKPQPLTPGDKAMSEVVYCRNPWGGPPNAAKGKDGAWQCQAIAGRLPGVPFVAIADVDGDGVNDIVAQTNGFPPFVPGRLLWFKGLRQPK